MADKYKHLAPPTKKPQKGAWIRFRMCVSKRAYETREQAEASFKGNGAYKCPICKQWHSTSKKKGGGDAKKT